MKFGCEFYREQVPLWAKYYIDYDGLKQLLKQTGDHGKFNECLQQEAAKVNEFLSKQLHLIDNWTEAVLSRFGAPDEPLVFIPRVWDNLTQIAQSELDDLRSSLGEILDIVIQLDAFYAINRDATRRLSEKVESAKEHQPGSTTDYEELIHPQSWCHTRLHLEEKLKLVERSSKRVPASADFRSLLLQSVGSLSEDSWTKEIYRTIGADDSSALMCCLASAVPEVEYQTALSSVLRLAIIHRASKCIQSVLGEISAPLDEELRGPQDFLHQLIIQFSQRESCGSLIQDRSSGLEFIGDVFRELSPYQHHLLQVKNSRGRYPLHYAAEHGLLEVCAQILKFTDHATMLEADASGDTPLQLAVCSGHTGVVKAFIAHQPMLPEEILADVLSMAIQSHSPEVAKCLAGPGRGLDLPSRHSQTPLYLAAREGLTGVIEALLDASDDIDLNMTETSRCWTPLMVAAVNDHVEAVQTLLQAGGDAKKLDWRGWSAIDHAAYRAHMVVVDILQQATRPETVQSSSLSKLTNSQGSPEKMPTQRPTATLIHPMLPPADATHTFFFVNLGSFDHHRKDKIVDLEPLELDEKYEQVKQSYMFLEISASNCREKPCKIPLPIWGDISTTTRQFSTTSPENTRISFKLIEDLPCRRVGKQLIGTGIAVPSSISGWFRPGRQSLRRDCTLALSSPDGDYVGSVFFTLLSCRPYKPKGPIRLPQQMRCSDRTQIVGHRGMGLNESQLRRLQIGEHTLQSLTSAMEHGADFIEFDVQVTRDHQTIIYHDWLVSETGIDAPVHSISFPQWMAISDAQSSSHHETRRGRLPWDERSRPTTHQKRLARSISPYHDHPTRAMFERMKHTFDYTNLSMKPNTRGDFIHDTFVTLGQLFEKFPEDVSFDIEIKYPSLSECADYECEPYWSEMNDFLDTIMDVVFELGRGRSIFFTCFNPEICILLSTKQKTYPVLFLNDSMSSGQAGDVRATSLQQAIRFARRWNLQGIIMAAEPFVAAPKLINVVKDLGLYCGSYGALNDIPELAKKQADRGIDMLVVNNVKLISRTLRQ